MRLLGKRASIVMPPEHLTYWSHRSLRTLLEPAGFRIRRLESNTVYLGDWVRFLGRSREESAALASHRTWYERATRPAMAPRLIGLANALLGAARIGDQMLVAAQRPEQVRCLP
jgi:hypothetical protein